MCTGAEPLIAGASEAASAASPYLLAASTAAQLGSTYARARQVKAQDEAQAAARQAEMEKQHELQQEANKAILGTAESFNPQVQTPQLEALQAARTAAAAPAPMPTQGYQTTTASAPKVVQTDQERKLAEAMTEGGHEAQRAGMLRGYGDTALQNQIRLGRAGQQVGQLANFSRGLSNTLPMQLESAYGKGRNWGEAADIADAAGRLGTIYAMTRKGVPLQNSNYTVVPGMPPMSGPGAGDSSPVPWLQ